MNSQNIKSNLNIVKENIFLKRSNEILYIFNVANEFHIPFLSKIGVQKCIYLAEVLAPLRKIVLSFLNFIYHHKGPYSKDIQNILDYLVSLDAIEIDSFSTNGKNLYINYKISEAGKSLTKNLIYESLEKEKHEWFRVIIKLINMYSKAYGLSEEYSGLDKIINLVYQEPSFNEIRKRNGKKEIIPINNRDNLTIELIEFLKNIEDSLPKVFDKTRYKLDLEGILLAFFEYLYTQYLSEKEQK